MEIGPFIMSDKVRKLHLPQIRRTLQGVERVRSRVSFFNFSVIDNHRLTPCPRKPSSCKPGALKLQNLSFSVGAPAGALFP